MKMTQVSKVCAKTSVEQFLADFYAEENVILQILSPQY